jgi:nanoRNase/pAp phosphatase (c-di-AMP/oligoRNAs hydrolase)
MERPYVATCGHQSVTGRIPVSISPAGVAPAAGNGGHALAAGARGPKPPGG